MSTGQMPLLHRCRSRAENPASPVGREPQNRLDEIA